MWLLIPQNLHRWETSLQQVLPFDLSVFRDLEILKIIQVCQATDVDDFRVVNMNLLQRCNIGEGRDVLDFRAVQFEVSQLGGIGERTEVLDFCAGEVEDRQVWLARSGERS